MNKDKLKDWEENFINIYFSNGMNATEAYTLSKPGTTYESARTLGNKLLTKVHIQKRISEKNIEIRNREEVKLGEIVSHLKRLIQDCISDDDRTNMLKALDQLSKIGGFYTNNLNVKGDLTVKGEQALFGPLND